jgi:hypothetical protein
MAGRSTDQAPFHDAVAVTTSDATVIPGARSLYIGVSGDVAVRMVGGGAVTFKAVPVGILHVQVDMVKATSTTATNIVALY